MKKLALLLTLAFGLTLTAFAQHSRRVMVEEFTNASCGPCAANNPAFNATLDANADFVTPLKYQVWWPGFDPMYNQTKADVDPRVAYYGVTGVPNGIENGVNFGVPGGYSASAIEAAYNNLTPVTMTVTHSLSADYKSVNVTVAVTSDAALTGNLTLRAAVAERNIVFAAAPGSNGEKEFSHVMRKMLPNSDGTPTGNFAAGETKTYNFTWQLANFYNLNEIEVVAWLQDDDSQEVWQSEISVPNTVIPGGNYAKVNLTAAASYKLTCDNFITPTFNLKNVGTAALTSAEIQYRLDDGAWSNYSWTGNLNPNLQTAVSLPAVTFPTAGTHKIEIFIASTNNGTQINQVDASGAITVNTFFAATTPPVTDDFEGNFPSDGWALKPTSAGDVWQQVAGGYGAYGTSDASIVANFYAIQSGTLEMYMPKLDLTNATSAALNFDYSYAYYVSGADVFKDRLTIEVSTNCGTSWTAVYDKEGDDLATADPSASSFVPTENDWIAESIDLSAYAGVEILVRFKGVSGYGNNLWMDNVNFAITSGTKELTSLSNFTIQPNPTRSTAEVRISLNQPESLQMQVFGMDGALLESRILGDFTSGSHVIALDAARYASGSYRVVLQGKGGVAQTQWVVVK